MTKNNELQMVKNTIQHLRNMMVSLDGDKLTADEAECVELLRDILNVGICKDAKDFRYNVGYIVSEGRK